MNILLVNDDGIHSPELRLLARTAKARGHHILVCAPSQQQSAKGHSFTISSPVMVHPVAMEGADAAWAVDGTPVDCTRLGLMELSDAPIDLVISGINQGYNIGLATYVSGTVGAAREAAFQGVKAMAVSAEPCTPAPTMAIFVEWVLTLAEQVATFDLPRLSVVNVNVPPVEVHELQPPRLCPINCRIYHDHYERRESPRGGEYFWLAPVEDDPAPEPGSDCDLLAKGHITVSILTVDGGSAEGCEALLEEM